MTATISRSERAKLSALEDVLTTARRWAAEEAKALLEIKERQLWTAYGDKYKSFEQYATERWGYEAAHIYRLCSWAEVLRNVADSPIGFLPARESVARPMTGYPKATQREISKRVWIKHGETPTALQVEEVVQEVRREKAPQKSTERPQRVSGSISCCNAIHGLNGLVDNSVSLILFSPPYAMQRSKDYPSVPESRFPGWMVEVLTAAKPKLTDNASIMINAREHVKDGTISDYLLRTRLALREIGLFEIDTLIWHKPDAPPTGRPDRPRRAYEHIYWFSPSRDPFTAVKACGTEPVEKRERMTRTRTLKSGHYTEQSFQRFNGDMTVRVTDVVVASHGTSSAKIKHPSPYPLSLADQLVRTYSPVGSLVCDPMCGSGTTCLAAKQADRNWVGFDVVPRFVREAQARLDKA